MDGYIIHPSTQSIYWSIHPFIYLSIHLSNYPSTHLYIYSYLPPSTYLSIHIFIYTYIHPPIIYLSITYDWFQPASQPSIKRPDLQGSGEDRLERQRHWHHDPLYNHGDDEDDGSDDEYDGDDGSDDDDDDRDDIDNDVSDDEDDVSDDSFDYDDGSDDGYVGDDTDSGDDDDASLSSLQYVPKKLGLLGSGFLEVAVVAL